MVQKILLAKAREDTITVDDAQVEEVLENQIQRSQQVSAVAGSVAADRRMIHMFLLTQSNSRIDKGNHKVDN